MAHRVVIWDFDGTLAYRRGHWPDCLVEILNEDQPGHGHTAEAFRARMQRGFRWHEWKTEHERVTDPRTWWAPVEAIAASAFMEAGFSVLEAERLAARLSEIYLRRVSWAPFEDSLDALALTRAAGWKNVILSNHCPELPDLVRDLGLDGLVERVFNSATSGFEKPHSEAFRGVLTALGSPRDAWMVGDQPRADVEGAEAVGIPAILVRTDAPSPRRARTALEAGRLIVG
ncbi:MAG: HAD family hydrolase [Chloroflexi bacterium]|nr:HAD family hydrolase [Chloroflexota bacterium]